jgi:hypothetical protein
MLDELLHRMSSYTPVMLETDARFPEAAVGRQATGAQRQHQFRFCVAGNG